MVDTYRGEAPRLFHRVSYGLVRFFTAQRMGLANQGGRRAEDYQFVRRVIGLPGDEVSMEDYIVRVRARGSGFSLTEFELTERDYTTTMPNLPSLWDSGLPFSGNMDAIVLGDNEVFLLSDDRSSTNDFRLSIQSIAEKAIVSLPHRRYTDIFALTAFIFPGRRFPAPSYSFCRGNG